MYSLLCPLLADTRVGHILWLWQILLSRILGSTVGVVFWVSMKLCFQHSTNCSCFRGGCTVKHLYGRAQLLCPTLHYSRLACCGCSDGHADGCEAASGCGLVCTSVYNDSVSLQSQLSVLVDRGGLLNSLGHLWTFTACYQATGVLHVFWTRVL